MNDKYLEDLYLKDFEIDENDVPFYDIGDKILSKEEKEEYFKIYMEKKKEIKEAIKNYEQSGRYSHILNYLVHRDDVTYDDIYFEIYGMNVSKIHTIDRHHKEKWWKK